VLPYTQTQTQTHTPILNKPNTIMDPLNTVHKRPSYAIKEEEDHCVVVTSSAPETKVFSTLAKSDLPAFAITPFGPKRWKVKFSTTDKRNLFLKKSVIVIEGEDCTIKPINNAYSYYLYLFSVPRSLSLINKWLEANTPERTIYSCIALQYEGIFNGIYLITTSFKIPPNVYSLAG